MMKWVRGILLMAWAAVLVGAAGVWPRSYFWSDAAFVRLGGSLDGVVFCKGRMLAGFSGVRVEGDGICGFTSSLAQTANEVIERRVGNMPAHYGRWGFFCHLGYAGGVGGRPMVLEWPVWAVLVPAALLPWRRVRRWRRMRYRRRRGLCLRCGYDLRATPVRCPECGEEVDQRSEVRGQKSEGNIERPTSNIQHRTRSGFVREVAVAVVAAGVVVAAYLGWPQRGAGRWFASGPPRDSTGVLQEKHAAAPVASETVWRRYDLSDLAFEAPAPKGIFGTGVHQRELDFNLSTNGTSTGSGGILPSGFGTTSSPEPRRDAAWLALEVLTEGAADAEFVGDWLFIKQTPEQQRWFEIKLAVFRAWICQGLSPRRSSDEADLREQQ